MQTNQKKVEVIILIKKKKTSEQGQFPRVKGTIPYYKIVSSPMRHESPKNECGIKTISGA